MKHRPKPAAKPKTRVSEPVRSAESAALAVPAPSAGAFVVSDDGGLAGTPLVLLVAGPALLLALAMLPAHALSTAGGIGRALGRGRVLLVTMALAIWLGVFVSLLLGSSP